MNVFVPVTVFPPTEAAPYTAWDMVGAVLLLSLIVAAAIWGGRK